MKPIAVIGSLVGAFWVAALAADGAVGYWTQKDISFTLVDKYAVTESGSGEGKGEVRGDKNTSEENQSTTYYYVLKDDQSGKIEKAQGVRDVFFDQYNPGGLYHAMPVGKHYKGHFSGLNLPKLNNFITLESCADSAGKPIKPIPPKEVKLDRGNLPSWASKLF